MDVVYILGKGSLANNDELRYSLRSLQRYCTDLGKIFIVGECPDFLQDVIHIPCPDAHEKAWKNTLAKVRAACSDSRLSDDFLLMNDDFFAFDTFSSSELPFFADRRGSGGINGQVDYAVHRPIRLNKQFYLKMPIDSTMKAGYSPRSFYGNFFRAPATYCKDLILRTGTPLPPLDEQLGNESWASIDDVTMCDIEFRVWIDSIFPEASRWEASV